MSRLNLLFVLAGCAGDRPAPDRDFEAVFRAAGDFAPVEEGVVEVPVGDVAVEADENYYCTTTRYARDEGRADQPVFNPAAGVLYPGNLVQGAAIVEGVLQPIPLERGPGTIVIDLVNGATEPGRELDQVSFLEVQTAVNEIVGGAATDLPARTRYSMQQVRSAEELAVAIGVDFETIGFALEGDFNYQASDAYNRYVVKLTQEYYTLVYDLPTSLDEVFDPSVTADQLGTYVAPGNPAAFVHSVTYGRMFYLLIQSTDSVQAMSASIEASFQAVAAGGGMSAEATYISELSDLSIGGWAEGGDASMAAGALRGDLDALAEFLEQGGSVTTGVPLSYVVRSVNRPDLVLNIGRADEYEVKECVPVGMSLDEPIFGYDGDVVESAWQSQLAVAALTTWPDLLHDQTSDFDGVPPSQPYAGFVLPGSVNSRGDAVAFQAWTESSGRVQFPGSAFRDQDYTVFAVAKNPHGPGDDRTTWFLWSPSLGDRQGVHLGFRGGHVVMSHGGDQELVAPPADDRRGTFFVYSFVFDRETGMSVYQNGVLLGTDPTAQPLLSFNSASLGVADEGRFAPSDLSLELANVQAYAIAVTDVQRRYIEDSLIERYGL